MFKIITTTFLFIALSWAQHSTPTKLTQKSINFTDDLDFKNLELAINRQLLILGKASKNSTVTFGQRIVSIETLKEGLTTLKGLSEVYISCLDAKKKEDCQEKLNANIHNLFEVYEPDLNPDDARYSMPEPAHYTSYYSPDFDASAVKIGEYINPIYTRPEVNLRNKTRKEIDFEGALEGKDLEIAYVKQSLFDIYLLHIEGGGRIKFRNADGSVSTKYLAYQGSNSQSFNFIHKYMQSMGYLTNDRSIEAQRQFLSTNPDKHEEIYSSCPSYIYFKITDVEPHGIENLIITENRTMALDKKFYPISGLLGFISTRKPIRPTDGTVYSDPTKVPNMNYSRFYIHQDTGGAIKGKARADLYAGFGPDAEFAANYTNYNGEMFFLVLKDKDI